MTSLGIPPPYRAPLTALAQVEDVTASDLVSRIEKLPSYAAVTEIESAVGEVFGNGAGAGVATSLLSLRGLFRTMSADEIGLSLGQSRELELDPEARARLRERASALLATPAFSTTAVAVDLQTQHQRNYQEARIFTDLRPVFPDDVGASPTGAVVVEMLQLQTWSRDGETETFFIALDEQDLGQLRDAVDRALAKTVSLRRFLDEKGLAYFQLEEAQE